MKRLFLSLICITLSLFVNAQIAKWLIEPLYDNLQIATGADIIFTDSAKTKIFWSLEGNRLFETSDDVSNFCENISILTKPGSTYISGLLKMNGEFISINNYFVTSFGSQFSCGNLLVYDGQDYKFIGTDGIVKQRQYASAYPFVNGYASCVTSKNTDKSKDSYHVLIDSNGRPILFSYNEKFFPPDAIDFISSVNDENLAVVVIKGKIFLYNTIEKSLSPVFDSAEESNAKYQAKLIGDLSQSFSKNDDETSVLIARCRKNDSLIFVFDKWLKPISFSVQGIKTKYKNKEVLEKTYNCPLRIYSDGRRLGLLWDGLEMFPPQFEDISACFDNKALVKVNNKYGMLEIDKEKQISLKIYDGEDIPFLHQKFKTNVVLDIPTFILAEKTYLEFIPNYGIELDKKSKKSNNTEFGNEVKYNCTLTIPENLSDEVGEIKYPYQITYDGLISPIAWHKVNAWYYQKYEVEIDENQKTIEQGTFTFAFNIRNQQPDGAIVKLDVAVSADSLRVQQEDKLSETRYKYKVFGLNEGINNITVQVYEQGCPPAVFNFEIEYHKPIEATETTEEESEKVVIKKTPKKQKQSPKISSPQLEI